MTRRRVALWAAALVGVAVLLAVGPQALRRIEFFRVRQVEIVGLAHLAPEGVLAALRLPPTASVFDDADLLADRVRGVTGVADASVRKRFPRVLRVLVVEVAPVAFVPSVNGLVVVDAEGHELPFDPTLSGLDLPIAATADAALVGVLARIMAVDPALFRQVGAARHADWGAARAVGSGRVNGTGRRDVLLEVGSRRVWLSPDAGPEVIQAVARVMEDLAAQGRVDVELDARYAGQVVVRRRSTA